MLPNTAAVTPGTSSELLLSPVQANVAELRRRTLASDEARSVSWAARTLALPAPSGSAAALPLVGRALDQSRSPAVADIIGARRVRPAVMISSGSIPCR
jgi:hypothetical protein